MTIEELRAAGNVRREKTKALAGKVLRFSEGSTPWPSVDMFDALLNIVEAQEKRIAELEKRIESAAS